MPKISFFYTLLLILSITFLECKNDPRNSNANNTTQSVGNATCVISGKVANGANLDINLDRHIHFTNTNRSVAQSTIGSDGSYTLQITDAVEAGIYRIKIGERKYFIALDGTEKDVKFNTDLASTAEFDYSVQGSAASEKLIAVGKNGASLNAGNILTNIQGMNSVVASFIAFQTLGPNGSEETLNVYREVNKMLQNEYPNMDYTKDMGTMLLVLDDPIQIGKVAPEITLKDPSGKEMSLSSLKGKVVLLDFWASWCRPCRMASPTVVKLYDKYNKKGFEVFSVSLDRPGAEAAWKKAIADDKLRWKYHVSELRGWEGPLNAVYRISSIPKTFLLDKEGKFSILEINPLQHPAELEAAIQKLL